MAMQRSTESSFEFLYMGCEDSTRFVEGVVDESARDPFDVVAELEEELGYPLALH